MNTDTIQATEKIWHLESIDLSKVFQDVRVAHLNETIDSKNFAALERWPTAIFILRWTAKHVAFGESVVLMTKAKRLVPRSLLSVPGIMVTFSGVRESAAEEMSRFILIFHWITLEELLCS